MDRAGVETIARLTSTAVTLARYPRATSALYLPTVERGPFFQLEERNPALHAAWLRHRWRRLPGWAMADGRVGPRSQLVASRKSEQLQEAVNRPAASPALVVDLP